MTSDARTPGLMTVDELAQRLGLSSATIYRFVRRGVLPAVRLGAQIRFVPSAIDLWLGRGGTRPPGSGVQC
jgi:excisionase family DNA binding protein